MGSVLDSGSGSPGSSHGWGHCAVFLSKTHYSHSASLHSGEQMGTGKFNARGCPSMDWHPIQGGVEIFLVTSCYRNQDKLDGLLGLYTDLTFYLP